jgi:hypothetical protein
MPDDSPLTDQIFEFAMISFVCDCIFTVHVTFNSIVYALYWYIVYCNSAVLIVMSLPPDIVNPEYT